MKCKLCVRSQKSVGSGSGKFGGPDRYVVVLSWDGDVEAPYTLRRDVLAARGIKFEYMGEGYSRHSGPRSALGQALAAGRDRVAEIVRGGGHDLG